MNNKCQICYKNEVYKNEIHCVECLNKFYDRNIPNVKIEKVEKGKVPKLQEKGDEELQRDLF